MNHGIKVVRHEEVSSIPGKAPGRVFMGGSAKQCSDEELIAYVLCSRLHDDEATASVAQQCLEIHVLPWTHEPIGPTEPMQPDMTCVVKRTAALRRWRGVSTSRSDTARSVPSAS